MSTNLSIFTLTGFPLEKAIELLDQELPAGAYKELPGAVDLTDIDPNWMRKTLNQVFGLCGWGWGYEFDPQNLTYRYETRETRGGERGVYVAIISHLRFWYRLIDGNTTVTCTVHATGASENSNIAYAMKGALSNAIGNAVSNVGFQESVYLGLRSHRDFPNRGGNGKVSVPKPASVPQAAAPAAAEPEPAGEGEAVANPGNTVIHFGKMKDKTLAEVWASGAPGQGWVRWCANTDGKGFDPQGKPENVHLQRMARAFLMTHAAYAG